MRGDPENRRRAWSLPDDLVYVIGVLYLAVSAVVRVGTAVVATSRRWLVDVAWPAARRSSTGLRWQVAGVATRSARAAPTWLARRRTALALWSATTEVITRRCLVAVWRSAREAAVNVVRAPAVRWSTRFALRGAGVGAAVVIALVIGSGPVLTGVAHVVIGELDAKDLPALAESSVVVSRDGVPIGVVERERRRVIDASTLPRHVRRVVVAAEDHRFADHDGYDLEGLARAGLANVRAGEVEQGGSTITQQLAKLNFTDGSTSLGRKAEELLYAVRLEDQFSKGELLERYLNQVYFGNGAHGIAAAAAEYFGTGPERLTLAQSALLAGVIQAPNALDPRQAPAEARRRRDAVLDRAADEGLVPRDRAVTAAAEPVQLAPPPPRPPSDPILGAIRAEVQQIEALGATPAARLERFETGGLRIETTLDPSLQHDIQVTIGHSLPDGAGPTAAVAAVDPRSGAVRALLSGRSTAGGFDLARDGRRQPGSAFKPLTAVAALEKGLALDQPLVGDGPVEFDFGGPDRWRIDNFDGNDVGTTDLRTALTKSVNTAFAQLGVAVGPEAIGDVVERVGIDAAAALGPTEERGPSLALGGLAHGVSPLELAGAYAAFANDGRRPEPYLVERIVDADGDVVFEHAPRVEQAIDPAIAGRIRAILEQAVAEGTGRAARIDGVPILGKTGTSQDAADAWFVGSVSNLTAAVWIGHPESRQPMPHATGGALAAPMWRQIVETWIGDNPPQPWPEPPPLDRTERLPLPRPQRPR